jgi:hypothetical protein
MIIVFVLATNTKPHTTQNSGVATIVVNSSTTIFSPIKVEKADRVRYKYDVIESKCFALSHNIYNFDKKADFISIAVDLFLLFFIY